VFFFYPVSVTENVRHVAALARAVAILRRSPDPGKPQKDALRALVAAAAGRSATLRFYESVLSLDGETVPTTDPRLAAFAERLVAQNVAEITIAQGAGPDELLALTMGLASDAGAGRIKERLRDAGSAKVMVVLHQYEAPNPRSVSAAFEKVKFDQGVLAEWNKFLDQGAKAEKERVEHAKPGEETGGAALVQPPAPAAAPKAAPPAFEEVPPPAQPRQPRPSTLQEAATPEGWFASFERSVKNRFADHFPGPDWAWRVDRTKGTVTAGDRQGRASLTATLPPNYLEQSAWLLAGKLLEELRRRAEEEGEVRRKR